MRKKLKQPKDKREIKTNVFVLKYYILHNSDIFPSNLIS